MRNKIIVASDSFKGSLSSRQVGDAASKAVEKVFPEMICENVTIADGGEGTVDAIVSATEGRKVRLSVTGPLCKPVDAEYGICGDTAVIEMAAASGLTLVPDKEHNPWVTTSYGTGELILDAIRKGCRKFLVGIGGSATNDAGIGMLKALGYRFFDKDGNEAGITGGETGRIVRIDSAEVIPELKESSFIVACDVNNPLTGINGASHVFGPQKGADKDMVVRLDTGLSSFASVTSATVGKDYSSYPGAGAAGGMGFAFLAYLGASLKSGVDMVLDAIGFDEKLKNAKLVITGEGRLDSQTCMGKAPYGVLKRSMKRGVPVIAIGGSVDTDAVATLISAGFTAVFPITGEPMDLETALLPEVAYKNVERTVAQILRTVRISI